MITAQIFVQRPDTWRLGNGEAPIELASSLDALVHFSQNLLSLASPLPAQRISTSGPLGPERFPIECQEKRVRLHTKTVYGVGRNITWEYAGDGADFALVGAFGALCLEHKSFPLEEDWIKVSFIKLSGARASDEQIKTRVHHSLEDIIKAVRVQTGGQVSFCDALDFGDFIGMVDAQESGQ